MHGDLRQAKARHRSIGMVPRTLLAFVAPALVAAVLLPATSAPASQILVLDDAGHVRAQRDRLPDLPPADPAPPATAAPEPAAVQAARGFATLPSEIRRLRAAAAIAPDAAAAAAATYRDARRLAKRLKGRRRLELLGVIRTFDHMAADGSVTAARLPLMMLTLRRNAAWWRSGPLLPYGRRVRFAHSRLVWQSYPGQGIQVQWLGTFARANQLYLAGGYDDELGSLLDEIVAGAVPRAGGIAWEYLFTFGGGRPPWASGLAQATAIQALSRGAVRLKHPAYFVSARSALGLFAAPPPSGVRVATAAGAHYLAYTYAPGQRIFNAFFQSVVGLHDFAALANDARARALYLAGAREAAVEVTKADTGTWSLYSPGVASDIGYHKVLRDFARSLCRRLQVDRERAATELRAAAGPDAALTSVRDNPDPAPFCIATRSLTRELYSRLGLFG